ncbi:MAG: CPXCG motif-containing cysteine-rich protein [Nitrospina sp.]|jgi:transcription elongation factor Elf1|nr:CPXCG motif-containing cysteine-rich protein [Nitrospina sp.]MBT3415275.1 CPXCG motif-containing cysteine-rich protein [Nitrospina sp.]MBT3855947.1 CPXCG motif-containing cysteine-rich protein [Nitrospina sp.]MBT4105957.1 CPXCG motif-containing cysteine-rich protein [Nitrospina sp.]MBT4389538.1 CPXCG motif-containing cysteine-rich protein [Nitrospina sp.]
MEQYEQFFNCPHCGETISVLVDLSISNQEYIEDCEVCCRPIEISYAVGADGEIEFEGGQS